MFHLILAALAGVVITILITGYMAGKRGGY